MGYFGRLHERTPEFVIMEMCQGSDGKGGSGWTQVHYDWSGVKIHAKQTETVVVFSKSLDEVFLQKCRFHFLLLVIGEISVYHGQIITCESCV